MTGIELGVIAGYTVTLGDAITAVSTLASVAGGIAQGNAAKAAGEAQARQLEYQAQLGERAAQVKEQQAGQERAAAQRNAIEQRRQTTRATSRVQALSAASGGGALDPTVIDILGSLESEGEYRALSALYQGEERARGLEYGGVLDRAGAQGDVFAADAARRAGSNARSRSFLKAGGTLLEGATKVGDRIGKRKSLYDKYSGDTPFATSDAYLYRGYSYG